MNVKGTRDIYGDEARKKKEVELRVASIFEKWGFEPLYTPALEYLDLLKGKYGSEEKLIYEFQDKSGNWLGLKYDQTVPLARFVAEKDVPLPYKRYVIDRAWRYDNPQRGRYREFTQCDIDIVGSKSISADAEVIACAYEVYKSLGIDTVFKISSRKWLNNVLGNPDNKVLRAIDKYYKIGEEEVKKLIGEDKLERLKNTGPDQELNTLFNLLNKYKVKYEFDPFIVRGLDYYTGVVWEVYAGGLNLSIGGGGRYDNLIKRAGTPIPATGMAIGLSRMLELAEIKTVKPVFLAVIDREKAIEAANYLRNYFPIDMDTTDKPLRKQMEYANKKSYRWVIIVGDNITIKDMESGKQQIVTLDSVPKVIKL